MKQYLPKKPIKRSSKVWVRTESEPGYFHNLKIYTEKEELSQDNYGLGERVVLKVTNNITGLYHWVYCDNFFPTVKLLKALLERKIYGCGTARSSRQDFPEMLRNLKPKWGHVASWQSGQVVATVWHYIHNVVTLLHTANLMSTRVTSSPTIMSSVWNITSMYILVPVWCIYILSSFVPSTAHSLTLKQLCQQLPHQEKR